MSAGGSSRVAALALALLLAGGWPPAQAQQARPRGASSDASSTGGTSSAARAARPPSGAQAQAPFDLSGYWVSLVTQNWRYRMVVPQRGDYAGIPINPVGKRLADAWSPSADVSSGRQCAAYGAANIMQVPERLHIRWQDTNTLRVDIDAGMQTRLLHFAAARAGGAAPPSLQGESTARWEPFTIVNSFGAPAGDSAAQGYGSLVVSTDDLLPGLLRKNGVPYGADTKMIEYWKILTTGTDQWLVLSTKVEDPQYLTDPYVYGSIFQREADGAKWHPGSCSLTS